MHKIVQKSASHKVRTLIFKMGFLYGEISNFIDRNRGLRIKYKRYYCLDWAYYVQNVQYAIKQIN